MDKSADNGFNVQLKLKAGMKKTTKISTSVFRDRHRHSQESDSWRFLAEILKRCEAMLPGGQDHPEFRMPEASKKVCRREIEGSEIFRLLRDVHDRGKDNYELEEVTPPRCISVFTVRKP